MFLTLLKKQLLEINWSFFVDRKTGKKKPKSKVVSSILLFVLLMGFVAVSFSTFTMAIIDASVQIDAGWYGFAVSGLIGLIFGVVGSVFNTYGMLYKSKDNELLTSMPIQAKDILLSRVAGAFAMSLLYTALVILPAVVLYQYYAGFQPIVLLTSLLMMLVEAVIVTVITCGLGYLVALISSKVKNKALTTVVGTIVFLVAYYFFIFKIDEVVIGLLNNIEQVTVEASRVYLFYLLGKAYIGDPMAMLVMVVTAIVLLSVAIRIMSINFFKIVNIKDAKSDKKFESKQIKTSSIMATLIKKELSLIVNTPIYLLNAGLGILFMVIGIGALLFKVVDVSSILNEILQMDSGLYLLILQYLPAVIIFLIIMVVSMDAFSASSISLEGKNVWQIQVLPVSYKTILNAKAYTCIILNIIPAVLLAIVAAISLKLDVVSLLLTVLGTAIFTIFFGYFDLWANVMTPNFKWTNPTSVVKNSAAVFIALFGGWAIMLLLALAVYYFVFKLNWFSPMVFLILIEIIFVAITFVLKKLIENKGTKLLREI